MRVLFVSGRDLNAPSSFEMYNIAKKISNRIQCYVMFPNFDEHILGSVKRYENKNLKIIITSNPIKILSEIKRIKPDVVHLWYSNIYQFTTALLAKLFTHSKVVLHVTDYEEFFIFSNLKSPIDLIKSILKIFTLKIFPFILDSITIISPNLASYVFKTKVKRKCPTYFLLPYTPKNYFKISREYMEKIKLMKKEFWFLYAGFISKFQGIEEIINSFLKTKIKKSKLIIIGNGPLKNKLRSKYKHNKNLVFIDYLKRNELFCYYKLSDCIVCYFPYSLINELRLPAKLREAMFFRKPIITTNIGFCKFLPNTSVLKVNFNENDLTNGMKKIYYNKKLRKKLSKNIKQQFKKWFQNNKNLNGVIKFYKKLYN